MLTKEILQEIENKNIEYLGEDGSAYVARFNPSSGAAALMHVNKWGGCECCAPLTHMLVAIADEKTKPIYEALEDALECAPADDSTRINLVLLPKSITPLLKGKKLEYPETPKLLLTIAGSCVPDHSMILLGIMNYIRSL